MLRLKLNHVSKRGHSNIHENKYMRIIHNNIAHISYDELYMKRAIWKDGVLLLVHAP